MSSDDVNRFILDKLEKVDDKLEEVRIKYAKMEEAFQNHEELDEKIHESVEKMSDDMMAHMNTMCQSLDKYNTLLQEHMRRTAISEQRLHVLTQATEPIIKKYAVDQAIEERISTKIKRWSSKIGIVSLILGVIISAMRIFEIF